MKKNIYKVFIVFLFIPLLWGCLTTSAILKNKTIIIHKGPSMPVTGINWGFPAKGVNLFPLFEEMGIQWLRTDFFWSNLEREKGVWTFDDTDYFCEKAKEKGYKILGVLAYDTPWIHEDPHKLREVTGNQLNDFLNYVEVVVTRYADQVDEWEIWNEPNLPLNTFWTASDKDFFELTTAVAIKIKEIDPTATIVGGSVWRFDKSFIKNMYEYGALENIDVLSYHPYYDKPEKIYDKSRELQDYLKIMGYRGSFRITEVGFNTYGRLPTSCPPEEQGRLVLETLVLLGTLKHPYIIWYTLYNGNIKGTGLWNDNYGLLIREGDNFEYKTGGWAFRRYNEHIAGKYPSKEKIELDKKLDKRIALTLYEDDINKDQLTMVLFGEKKSIEINVSGFENATLYNCASGEVFSREKDFNLNLVYNEPFIIVFDGLNISDLKIKEE